jgi:hypothetical protein
VLTTPSNITRLIHRSSSVALTGSDPSRLWRAVINNGSVNPDDANVKDWGVAATGMGSAIGLKEGYYSQDDDSDQNRAYAIANSNYPKEPSQFVNALGEHSYRDAKNGKVGNVSD